MAQVQRHNPARKGMVSGTGLDELYLGNLYDHRVIVRLFAYAWPHKLLLATAIAGIVGYIATMVAQPLIIAWGLNSFITPPPGQESRWGNIHIVGGVFIANTIANLLFNFMQYGFLARLSVKVLDTLRTSMFDHLQRQSVSFFDHNETGRIMSRVQNDVLQLQEFLDIGLITLGDLLLLLFIATTMLWISPILGLITLAVLPFLIALLLAWQAYAKPTFVRVREAISTVNGNLQENVSGVRVTQSMNRQPLNLERFESLNQAHLNATISASKLSASVVPAVEVSGVIAMGLVIIVGGLMALDGNLEIAFIVAFLLYIQRLFEPIRTMSIQFTMFQKAMASGARIFELLDTPEEMKDKPGAQPMPPIKGDLHFEDVSFAYVAGQDVLSNVSFHVEAGQTAAFVGLTGAGKTSLVSLISRFYEFDRGRILVDGIDVRDVTRQSLVSQMSMVLQEPFLYSTTIRDNIRFNHPEVSDADVEAAARAVGAHNFIMEMERGYDTVLQQRGANLSMGRRQLISFARAIVANPRILILDEATANIDSFTEQQIQRALKTILAGRTSLVIAHRISTITAANKIIVLEHGRIVEVGRHEELLQHPGLYSRLFAMNFGEALPKNGLLD